MTKKSQAVRGRPKRTRQNRAGARVPAPEGQSSMVSVHVPPRNYLQTHVASVQQSLRITLSWAANLNLLAGVIGFADFQQVILNSPFDPDAALGGLSAMGFAKYMAFYSKCFCLGARAKVKFATVDTGTNIQPMAVGATITTNSAALVNLVSAVQAGLCDYRVLAGNPDSASLTVGVDVAKFVDKPDLLDDPQFFCTSSANPGQLIVLHIWQNLYAAASTKTLSGLVEVEMDCVFTDPIPVI